jgi:glutathione S-transferase
MTGRLLLERKGIPYKRVDLAPAVTRLIIPRLGFDGGTVPAIKLDDGTRLQGTTTISRALDTLVPDPPLFPSDPERRAAVEAAESWGDEVLQPATRRLVWAAMKRDRSGMRSFMEGPVLGLPPGLAARTGAPVAWAARRINRATDEAMRADLEALPGMLDRVDGYVADGVIDPGEPNAAALQIAPSMRLLGCFDDFKPLLEGRPGWEAAQTIAPHFPGRIPAALPPELLPKR